MGELNKAHIEEKEKIVDRKSDQNLKDKGADSSENNNNIYDDDNRKHKHIGTEHYPKEGQRK